MIRDLWKRLTRRRRQEDEEPDLREGRSLHDSRDEWELRSGGVKMPLAGDQDRPKH